jgi:hypothetical protein
VDLGIMGDRTVIPRNVIPTVLTAQKIPQVVSCDVANILVEDPGSGFVDVDKVAVSI